MASLISPGRLKPDSCADRGIIKLANPRIPAYFTAPSLGPAGHRPAGPIITSDWQLRPCSPCSPGQPAASDTVGKAMSVSPLQRTGPLTPLPFQQVSSSSVGRVAAELLSSLLCH